MFSFVTTITTKIEQLMKILDHFCMKSFKLLILPWFFFSFNPITRQKFYYIFRFLGFCLEVETGLVRNTADAKPPCLYSLHLICVGNSFTDWFAFLEIRIHSSISEQYNGNQDQKQLKFSNVHRILNLDSSLHKMKFKIFYSKNYAARVFY